MSLNFTEQVVATMDNQTIRYKMLLYMSINMATLVECVLAAYITLRSRDLRERLSTWFSNSLTVSIAMFSSLSLVYATVLLMVPSVKIFWPSGCRVRMAQRYLSAVSCFTLVCLALDRYLAICWPLRYYDALTRTRCRLLCVACWLIPFLLLLLPCAPVLPTLCSDGRTDTEFFVAYTVVYTLEAGAISVFYVLVALEFRRELPCQTHDSSMAMSEELVRRRTVRSALLVIMLYSFLSLPHTVLPLASRLAGPGIVPSFVVEAGHIVHRLHLLLFLPMYASVNTTFNASLRSWWRCFCRRFMCMSGSQQQQETTPTEVSFVKDRSVGTL